MRLKKMEAANEDDNTQTKNARNDKKVIVIDSGEIYTKFYRSERFFED